MEFPGLYGGLQTGFEPIKFLDTRSVWVGHVIIILKNQVEMRTLMIVNKLVWNSKEPSVNLLMLIQTIIDNSPEIKDMLKVFQFQVDHEASLYGDPRMVILRG